jgi:PKD repeat protein
VVAHTYAAAGDYLVILTVTNACGQDAVSHVITVAGGCVPPGGADFDWYPPTPLIGQVVTFTGSAAGTEPLVYAWDLGDGTPAAGPVVAHTYAAAGDYLVVLTATNACGQGVVSHVVTVAGGCVPPGGADFAWSPLTPLVGTVVYFTATQSGGTAPLAYAWALGDGETGSGMRVAHTYAATGTFTVVLTVTNGCGQDGAGHAVVVVQPPPAYIIYLPVVLRQ